MDKKIALSEVQAMRGKTVGEYVRTLPVPSAKVQLSEGSLPDKLDDAHALLTKKDQEFTVALAEQVGYNARITVKQSADADAARIASFVQAGKITPAVAKQLITLSDRKRSHQLVHLAEGDPASASDDDQDMSGFLDSLQDLPDKGAVTDADQTNGAGEGDDPTGKEVAGGGDDAIYQLALQIEKKDGIPFEQAMIRAEKQLAAGGVA